MSDADECFLRKLFAPRRVSGDLTAGEMIASGSF